MPESAANAPETEAKPSRGLGSYVVWGFVVVMVYVLSIGPVLMVSKNWPPWSPRFPRVVDLVYATPMGYLIEKSPLRRPMGMYLHLWRPDMFDNHGDPVLQTPTR